MRPQLALAPAIALKYCVPSLSLLQPSNLASPACACYTASPACTCYTHKSCVQILRPHLALALATPMKSCVPSLCLLHGIPSLRLLHLQILRPQLALAPATALKYCVPSLRLLQSPNLASPACACYTASPACICYTLNLPSKLALAPATALLLQGLCIARHQSISST